MDKESAVQRVRGTFDLFYEEYYQYDEIRNKIKWLFESFGYGCIEVPIVEYTDLHLRKSGQEIISKMYTFKDYGNRDVCLRPEITASVVRAFINSLQNNPLPVKFYYIGPAFRYETPQLGRYRQFTHAGIELIGSKSPISDAEIISIACSVLQLLNLENYRVVIGHIGFILELLDSLQLDVKIKSLLIDSMEQLSKGKRIDDINKQLKANRQRKQIDKALEFIQELRQIKGISTDIFIQIEKLLIKYKLDIKPIEELKEIIKNLKFFTDLDWSKITIDLGFGRGLQYYTGMIFEVYCDALGAENQICGGGRYDELIRTLGGKKDVPALGFAYGLERVKLALDKEDKLIQQSKKPHLFIIPIGNAVNDYAIEIAQKLRNLKLRVEMDVMERKISRNLEYADISKIPFAVIVGEDEKANSTFKLRDMQTKQEQVISLDQIDRVYELIKNGVV
ncbi:MAG: histidine--tRNA ligase [bacterium]